MTQDKDNNKGRLRQWTIATISLMAIALGSCSARTNASDTPVGETSNTAAVENSEQLEVVTTFLPITQFTKAVAGDRAQIVQLIPFNVSLHDYQAKPADIQAIAEADVLVQNGLELEEFLEDAIENAENEDLAIIDSSENISNLLASDDGEDEEDDDEHEDHDEEEDEDESATHHDHDEEHKEAHGHGEEHEEANHHGHDHGEFDPHVWLDPKRAISQVETIRDGLIAADPEGKEIYTNNAAAFIQELQTLDTEISQSLQPYAGQTFITFHEFAGYFADSYDLNVQALVDIPEENPSPEDVRELIEIVKSENIQALLREPQVGEKTFSTLAKDLQIGVSTFDPIETGKADAIEPDYYLTIMRENAQNLTAALSSQ